MVCTLEHWGFLGESTAELITALESALRSAGPTKKQQQKENLLFQETLQHIRGKEILCILDFGEEKREHFILMWNMSQRTTAEHWLHRSNPTTNNWMMKNTRFFFTPPRIFFLFSKFYKTSAHPDNVRIRRLTPNGGKGLNWSFNGSRTCRLLIVIGREPIGEQCTRIYTTYVSRLY